MKLYVMLAFARASEMSNPVLVELFEILKRRGFEIELGIGNEVVLDPTRMKAQYDLYLLKSHSALWLSVAGIIHGQNGRLLNPYLSCAAVHNKVMSQRRLQAARIPTPHAWLTGDLGLLRSTVEERPLFIKPYIGGRGAGVRLVRTADELAALPIPDQLMLVQEYIPGTELKVYVVGSEVWAIRKPDGETREVVTVSSELCAIARECGRVFGLGLYGLDVIEGPEGPVVIDLNYFPSYKGVPDAADQLAEYIEGYALGEYPELAPTKVEGVESVTAEAASVWTMRWP